MFTSPPPAENSGESNTGPAKKKVGLGAHSTILLKATINALLATICFLVFPHHAADAMDRAQAKETLKLLHYYLPSRKATQLRESTEAGAKFGCAVGFNLGKDGIISTENPALFSILRFGDRLRSINGVPVDPSIDHPWGTLGSLYSIDVNIGDNMIWTVENRGDNFEITVPCVRNRIDFVGILEGYARALQRYRGREFLDDTRYANPLGCELLDWRSHASAIEVLRGKMQIDLYNQAIVASVDCRLSGVQRKFELGYFPPHHEIDTSFFTAQLTLIDYLEDNSVPAARVLREKLEKISRQSGADRARGIVQTLSNLE